MVCKANRHGAVGRCQDCFQKPLHVAVMLFYEFVLLPLMSTIKPKLRESLFHCGKKFDGLRNAVLQDHKIVFVEVSDYRSICRSHQGGDINQVDVSVE